MGDIYLQVGDTLQPMSALAYKTGGQIEQAKQLWLREWAPLLVDDYQAMPYWTKVWEDPAVTSGPPQIIGLHHGGGPPESHDRLKIRYALTSNPIALPCPLALRWAVVGDTSQVASCFVQMTYNQVEAKNPQTVTVSWDAPVGWGIYGTNSFTEGTAARTNLGRWFALSDAEVAAWPATPRSEVLGHLFKLWTPREGGVFPQIVCWDSPSYWGDSVAPVESHNDYFASSPHPPNVYTSRAIGVDELTYQEIVDDFVTGILHTGAKGVEYTNVTIRLKNSGGGTISELIEPGPVVYSEALYGNADPRG